MNVSHEEFLKAVDRFYMGSGFMWGAAVALVETVVRFLWFVLFWCLNKLTGVLLACVERFLLRLRGF